jgi:glycosyltransferase involved in cell wall biosynthesis
MNILFICSSSDWHMRLWLSYYAGGHTVLIFSDREDYLKRQEFDQRIKIIEDYGYFGRLLGLLNIKSLKLAHLNKLLSSRRYSRIINNIVDEHRVDIVHAHSLYYGFVSAGIRDDIPVVFTPMGSDIIIHAQQHPVYRYMARAAFLRADVVTGDSILLRNQGYKVGAKRDHNYIIQNGVDTEVVYPRENDLKKVLDVARDETLIFSPRALMELYNIDVIIESIALVRDAGYRIKCMFSYAFGGEYLARLKNRVKALSLEATVIWLGYLEYHEMAEHYNAADIVVSVPSSDSSPKSVYEAMFCRKPVIVSDLEWSYELLADCECLLRVKPQDPYALADRIKYLIDNKSERDELASNAYRVAYKYFDYTSNMKEMERIMIETIDRKKGKKTG